MRLDLNGRFSGQPALAGSPSVSSLPRSGTEPLGISDTGFFMGQMPLLPPNQPCQNIEGNGNMASDNNTTLHAPMAAQVKSTIPYEECWWGAHLPYLDLEPTG